MTSALRDMMADDADAVCDLCGVECESLDAMREWQDYAVCLACWEHEARAEELCELYDRPVHEMEGWR